MHAKGKTYLRIAGVLEIILGILTIALLFYALSFDEADSTKVFGTHPGVMQIAQLVGIYAQAGFQVIAGIIGILFANKAEKYKLCQLFGLLLLGLLVYNYILMEVNVQSMLSAFISLLPPLLYYMGATRNKDSAQ